MRFKNDRIQVASQNDSYKHIKVIEKNLERITPPYSKSIVMEERIENKKVV